MQLDTLERLIPELLNEGEITGQQTLALHLERYRFAAAHARPGRILDIACGVGYGTRILFEQAQSCTEAIGVDCSEESIQYAKDTYGIPGITYLVGDAMRFHDQDGFDTIVSLETIEHLPDYSGFLANIFTLLRPHGVLIGSVPTTPTVDANPHHCHDFTESSFRRFMARPNLQEIACLRQMQPFNPVTVLSKKETRLRDLRSNLPQYYLENPGAFLRRVWSTCRFGFSNRYITIVWQNVG